MIEKLPGDMSHVIEFDTLAMHNSLTGFQSLRDCLSKLVVGNMHMITRLFHDIAVKPKSEILSIE